MILSYKDFLELLKQNNIAVKDIEKVLGYAKNSIYNNWSKNKDIPKHAAKSIEMYIKLLEIEKAKKEFKKQQPQITLSKDALALAEAKCANNKISLGEYISSLVIANM